MTPQEEQLLNSLIDRLNQTSLQEKDPDAEALLNQRLAGNPDALYMLAQTVLVQNIALDQAKAQIGQLQQQMQQQQQQRPQPAHTTSFLGRLLGERDEQPAPPSQQQGPASGYQQVPPQYAPPPQYGTPQYPSAGYPPQYAPAGQPSFLRGAFQTAAGVAAGALAFEGIESMFRGFGHGGYGWGGPGFGGGFGERPVEVINNNYYDEPGRGAERGEHHGLNDGGYDPRNNDSGDNLRGFDNSGSGNSTGDAANDVSAFADQANFDDQSGLDQGLDEQSPDDQGLSDQSMDGGSSFDDSGSFDDGGGGMDDGGGF
ncbi:DUF2076 domain-containing protein [Occallatibacter savannae]|uniref:DUF2076 domain-containing protein n=1 Tax=Occallatibacter savannae TaxID=1002691 RepID=UPI0013A5A7AD|nr:DUF2076 domain-containing protein [Occallatibacter savannae]